MVGFAWWLREAKVLHPFDKSAIDCATPPHLVGALISQLSKIKLCNDFHIETKAIDEVSYDYNKLVDNIIEIVKVVDLYEDKLHGLDDDDYDEELEVMGEENLTIWPDWQHLLRASPERMKRSPKTKRLLTRQICNPNTITPLRRV